MQPYVAGWLDAVLIAKEACAHALRNGCLAKLVPWVAVGVRGGILGHGRPGKEKR